MKGLFKTMGIYLSYLLVGCMGVGFAFYLATGFLGQGQSQEPPSANTQARPQQVPMGQQQAPSQEEDESLAGAASTETREDFMAEVESYLEPFIYDPNSRRDPFVPYSDPATTTQEGFEGPLLPLQRFTLEELSLLGIIWSVNEPKAMFKDPNGEIHVVGVEERIGRKNGYIAVIREGEVVVVEASRRKGEVIYTSRVLRIEQ